MSELTDKARDEVDHLAGLWSAKSSRKLLLQQADRIDELEAESVDLIRKLMNLRADKNREALDE